MSGIREIRLDQKRFDHAIADLCDRDRDLKLVVTSFGSPPLWARRPGFQTLVHTILEQQVSLASAKAVLTRLRSICKPLNPENFVALRDSCLSEAGFSRQKMRYCRALAEAIASGDLNLRQLHQMNDADFREKIMSYPGIGPWTADVYLLGALRRPDVWPVGDLALLAAAHSLKNLKNRPSPAELEQIGEKWRPHRSSAARILWHHYLNQRVRK